MQLQDYLDKLANLNVNRRHGHPSPHKPVMLLALMDLFEGGEQIENRIPFEPELIGGFKRYFEIVKQDEDQCNPHLPYFHLSPAKAGLTGTPRCHPAHREHTLLGSRSREARRFS